MPLEQTEISKQIFVALLTNAYCLLKLIYTIGGGTTKDNLIQKEVEKIYEHFYKSFIR